MMVGPSFSSSSRSLMCLRLPCFKDAEGRAGHDVQVQTAGPV